MNKSKDYPKEILPYTHYRHFMRTGTLLSRYSDLTLVRRIDCPEDDIFVKSNDGVKKEIDTNRLGNLFGWSVNLLGGRFNEKKHSAFNPDRARVRDIWDGKTEINPPVLNVDYGIIDSDFCMMYLKAKDFHGQTFPYFKSIKMEDYYPEAKRKAERIAKDFKIQGIVVSEFRSKPESGADFKGRMLVNHYPTDLNYWHFQIDLYRATDLRPIQQSDKPSGEIKRIKNQLKRMVNEYYHLGAPKNYHLNRVYYIREVSKWQYMLDLIYHTCQL